MYAFKLTPAIKDYIWGGNRLTTEFDYVSFLDRQAEAWVLSCHKDGENIIENGEFEGRSLQEIIKEHPEYMGENGRNKEDFPILIKLIDAKDNLSVQVHPDEEYAQRVEGEHGKTEAWYILDNDEGAELIFGFSEDITKEEFREAIESNTLTEKVNRVKVKKGDLFFIEAGTLHAIGKGILLAEVQQNSNTTYRVYDYGRLQNGKPRELHIEKAIEVTSCKKGVVSSDCISVKDNEHYTETLLSSCDIFVFSRIDVKDEASFTADGDSFISLVCIDGNGVLEYGEETVTLYKGDSLFLPAGLGEYRLLGEISVLETKIP